jgi:hypothetical protein
MLLHSTYGRLYWWAYPTVDAYRSRYLRNENKQGEIIWIKSVSFTAVQSGHIIEVTSQAKYIAKRC